MSSVSIVVFAAKNLDKSQVEGKRIIEVGSCDFNGSTRPLIEFWQPAEYIGVDIIEGRDVDLICSAENLVEKFGKDSFDIVLSFEMLEHTKTWQKAISNMKNVCKPGGAILITTRSLGYPYHGYPNDFWRFEAEDMREIFSDFDIVALEKDDLWPGIFIKAKKPDEFKEINLSKYELYSIVINRKTEKITEQDFQSTYFKRLELKQKLKSIYTQVMFKSGQYVAQLLKL